jgi:bacteriorhodopsin
MNKQDIWELWFTITITLCIIVLIFGMIPHSIKLFPNWPYYAIASFINFILCIYIGTKPEK